MPSELKLTLWVCFLFLSLISKSQDNFIGQWEAHDSQSAIHLKLSIGEAEKSILYPAAMEISIDSFKAVYHLVLAKHNSRQLVISRNKFPKSESPFSTGNWPVMMNGSFLYNKDLKGTPQLSLARMITDKYGIKIEDPKNQSSAIQPLANQIFQFFKQGEITLKKNGSIAWSDSISKHLFRTEVSPSYFGITDTIFIHDKLGKATFNANKDNDIFSLQLNGNSILDQVDSKKTRDDEEFILDTGLNIICFFADDFGKNPPSSASVRLGFEKTIRNLDFGQQEHLGSNFIALKAYRYYHEEDETNFETFDPANPKFSFVNRIRTGDQNGRDSVFRRNVNTIGNIVSRSAELTFALWDDAVEDGDTVSLSINNNWIVKGFPVLKKPQYLHVVLSPGPNVITLIAENLGSIIPNTSVLEIIDGKKRKSFYVETDMNKNNQINIFYDIR
jgi:hypothetical protein